MNLPNKITMFRVILIPLFLVLMYFPSQSCRIGALAVFVIASLSDLVDGKIARKYNLVTDFGKFADPLADKMLVTAALVLLVELSYIPGWIVAVIMSREFMVTALRVVAASSGRVIAAAFSGKLKTTVQMAGIVLMLVFYSFSDNFSLQALGFAKFAIPIINYTMAAITIWSGGEYLYKNWDVIAQAK